MDLQLAGRTALVTGGTRGIGRAIVETFLDEGANVAFCARDAGEIASTEAALAGRGAGAAVGSVADVGDPAALTAWVSDAAGRFGGIDVVVSNVSALAIPDSPENWEASLRVDLMGTVHLVQAAMPHLEASDAAAIVTVASVSGREVDFASGPYGTVKSAIIAYTQGLAFQLAARGIRANSVSPGNTYFPGGVWEQIEAGNPELFATAMGLNPTGRMGTPKEMAAAVVFLASPVSSFTTGTNLVVDGALTRGVQL
jgi:NAD(P)-dependent dehydrogenase (short-subunit alcohol dehydrogenase family)